jgi:polyhydroxybutyrate depolymerase
MQLVVTGLTTAGIAGGLALRGARHKRVLEREHLLVQGRHRSFTLRVPDAYDGSTPAPLVLAFHGSGGRGGVTEGYTGLTELAGAAGMFVVYPDALDRIWSLGLGERRFRYQTGYVDDFAFMTQLLEHLRANYAIDARRIYATGMSLGGVFCYALAAGLPGGLRAIAPVAATLPVVLAEQLRQRRPTPVLVINGDADPLVSWDARPMLARLSGMTFYNVPETLDVLRSWHGCETPPEVTDLPLGERWNATNVRREVYRRPGGSAPLEFYAVGGGGHTWPGSKPVLPERLVGLTNYDFSASRVMLDFFQRCGA